MKKKVKKLLFDKLEFQGLHLTLFPNGKLSDSNSVIEAVVDAMIEFKGEKLEQEVDSKTEKILRIKEIIKEWGETTTAELEVGSSPCISSIGNGSANCSILVEKFDKESVDIVSYVGSMETSEDTIPYEDLEEDVIDEILDLLEDYDTDCFKTMQRCKN